MSERPSQETVVPFELLRGCRSLNIWRSAFPNELSISMDDYDAGDGVRIELEWDDLVKIRAWIDKALEARRG